MNNRFVKQLILVVLICVSTAASGQQFLQPSAGAKHWTDSIFKRLSKKEKIAQLFVLRASERKGNEAVFYEEDINKYIRKYNVGSVCLFQGTSEQQAEFLNRIQAKAATPLMVCVDGETGVGMRFSDVKPFPDQLTIGAVSDAAISYKVGKAIGEQCKRVGIHVNYAPVVDINNNPKNPVINFRSFGEDKYKVALLGTQLMKGMQDEGVMACAKHFPGHGDVAVDSHFDLPVINKSIQQLDSLELYPFKQLIAQGVGSVMVAHLFIPAIDTTTNQATSLSKKNVTGLLRNELGFKGLTFTDALEMKGVAKFYPQGQASVQSLIAGNDMLCLPGDIKRSIKTIRKSIRQGKLSWVEVNEKVNKVLLAKYNLGLDTLKPLKVEGISADLNSQVSTLKKEVYLNAITLLSLQKPSLLPLAKDKKVAFVGVGINAENNFAKQLKAEYNADCFYFDNKVEADQAAKIIASVKAGYDVVIVGLHQYKKYPANNFGVSAASLDLVQQLQKEDNTISFVFGNPYMIANMNGAANLVACYEDDSLMHQVAVDLLKGSIAAKGKLPVTVSPKYPYGSGITGNYYFPVTTAEAAGLNGITLQKIDSIAANAIQQGATPGCVVLVARNGKVGFLKAYGHMNYDGKEKVTTETVYDLASVTKITATTMAVMKLYEEGKLDLDKPVGTYVPWVRGTDKENLKIRDILLHQAGLVAFIPFYKETIDANGKPKPGYYSTTPDDTYSVRVADKMYMRKSYIDTLYSRIAKSKLGPHGKYIYSDNDFIFLGKIVEHVSGQSLNDYVRNTFYLPLHMMSTTFKPLEHGAIENIAPTENEKYFRLQQIRGDVHDPGAAMFGGVAGHAGLFSNAYDLAQIYQLLLNGGELNGIRLFKKSTIDYFTAYHSDISRRGLGFDKPEKENATSKSPYPSLSASPLTYGHTGFTGICVWVDPKFDLIYIFLSNRVCPDGDNNKLGKLNVRPDIQEVIYKALTNKVENTINKGEKVNQ
ncbi:glycoside hydrolase family 3 N-terminal domain-containing protein [Solitalea canadensis]|uniref:beta-N-acetylhexosaminidase n=1 Tax=Solitalea canadensis (strain ATCC 29591 / DSM 3403 / JCM 21819 / LMG 8368 / NBRC 15130 / NCIMB 12057 / USAM 9D) TaxID=929556 RepID=H8KV99_SOLCM|nr:glycoside hydrolase family 3 N-terminal domain-containing protein [Solitalea canadensis]AFD06157.1 beta-glucosidase-like glycosyl hydrolase [Solitalea canadensis DSM 3403]